MTSPTQPSVGEPVASDGPNQRERAILKRRAATLSKKLEKVSSKKVVFQVALVACGGERLGIPLSGLREFVDVPTIAGLPGLPPWMSGVTQVRGTVFSVVNLALWLAIDDPDEPTSLAVLDGEEGPIGLLVSEVLGIRDIYADDLIEDFDLAGREDSRPIVAVTEDFVSVLDLDQMLKAEDLIIGRSDRGT